ncbi:hypothetical protein [Nitrosospira sp. NpAV]|uniref:hypothetical protein n=1 Tax=Nitrosospira sp. NpAV TaxID=58133 RepID=UPI0005A2B705|nr:hypothetical protein [Nitrosospira sp. NpAV]KIO48916.1 hypothetical protein SQ11_09030 [Nitrosospira sp. NpAV]
MKTEFGKFLAALSMVGLMAAVSPSAMATENPAILAAAQKAVTSHDHIAVAKSLEAEAKQMQAKVQEQKELLEQYENKSYLYGRQAQDLQSHTGALVRQYEQIMNDDIKEAAAHRQIASKLDENHAASDTQTLSAASGLHQSSTMLQ